MKENVGGMDRTLRSVVGPALVWMGYRMLGRRRRLAGLATLVAGSLLSQTAVTKTCPMNRLFGIDTAEHGEPAGEKAGEKAA